MVRRIFDPQIPPNDGADGALKWKLMPRFVSLSFSA